MLTVKEIQKRSLEFECKKLYNKQAPKQKLKKSFVLLIIDLHVFVYLSYIKKNLQYANCVIMVIPKAENFKFHKVLKCCNN